MNRSNNNGSGARSARLELQLNLSLPPVAAAERILDAEDNGSDSSSSSSPSSCVSSDGSLAAGGKSSPMVIGACTRCLMYCMVAKEDYPTCINCKQPCLVGLLPDDGGAAGDDDDDDKRGKPK